MGFWNTITDGIEKAKDLLSNNEGPVAEDDKAEDIISQGEALLDEGSQDLNVPEKITPTKIDEGEKSWFEKRKEWFESLWNIDLSPDKDIKPEEVKKPTPTKTPIEEPVSPEEKITSEESEQKFNLWDMLYDGLDSIFWEDVNEEDNIWVHLVEWLVNTLWSIWTNFRVGTAIAKDNNKVLDEMNKIEWINTEWLSYWVAGIWKNIQEYEKAMRDYNFETTEKMNKMDTQEERIKYAEDTYTPYAQSINQRFFNDLSPQWLNPEQYTKVRDLVIWHDKVVASQTILLHPEIAEQKAKRTRIFKEVESQHLYLNQYKSNWWQLINDPKVLYQANRIDQAVAWQIADFVFAFNNLSKLEIEEWKTKILDNAKIAITVTAMQDTWKTDEEVEEYLKWSWVEKRSFFKKWTSAFNKPIMEGVPYLLWDQVWNLTKIYDEYDKINQEREIIDSPFDYIGLASIKFGNWYSENIKSVFNSIRAVEQWPLADYWFFDFQKIADWDSNYKLNTSIETVKNATEIAAVATAVVLTDWMLSWIWAWIATELWATAAWQVWTAEALTSVFIKWLFQNTFIEWALKSHNPLMQIDGVDSELTFVLYLTAWLFEWANAANKVHNIDLWRNRFIRHTDEIPWINFLVEDLWLSIKEKAAVQAARPAMERTVRAMSSVNPELVTTMVKDSLARKQLYRYIKKQIIPQREWLVEKFWGDQEKAFKEFSKVQDDLIKTWMDKYEKVYDPSTTIMWFLDDWEVITNSSIDAAKVTDITFGKPRVVKDWLDNAINYFFPNRYNQTVKADLFNLAHLSEADTLETVVEKIKWVFYSDVKWTQLLLDTVTHQDANWRTIFFDNWKQNKNFEALAKTAGIDFSDVKNGLLEWDLWIVYKNMTNNWYTLIWEMQYDKIKYRQATDLEKENPDIPKFKVDWNMLVPEVSTDVELVRWKRIWWKINNIVATADGVATKDINWSTYVESPLELNVVVKDEIKNIKKFDPYEAQKEFIKFASERWAKTDDVNYLDDNDLFVKVWTNIEEKNPGELLNKTTWILQSIFEAKDTTKLLQAMKKLEWSQLKRYLWYLSVWDNIARTKFLAEYIWPKSSLAETTMIPDETTARVWNQIGVKDQLADKLVEIWRFESKELAYKYVDENYDQIIAMSVANKNITDKEYLLSTLPERTMKFLKLGWTITDPLWEFFMYNDFSPELIKQINKISKEYDIIRSYDLDKNIAWSIDHNLKELVINWLFLNESEIFSHEFWHRLDTMFTDRASKIIDGLFLKDQDKAIKALMKKYPWMDRDWALLHLNDHRTFTDSKHNWYIGPDHYQAMSRKERVAENVKKFMTWWAKSVPKEARTIFKIIMDWIRELYKMLFNVKSTSEEFSKIMNNLSEHIDEKVSSLKANWKDYLKWNINFYDKNWVSVFSSPIESTLSVSLADEIESQVLKYINENDWLTLDFLVWMEWAIEAKAKVWTRSYSEAKRVIHNYFTKYYNWNERSIIDMSSYIDDIIVSKPKVDLTHEFLLARWDLKSIAKENWLNPDDFNLEINERLRVASEKYSKNTYVKDMTKWDIDKVIKQTMDEFNVYLLWKAKETRAIAPDKINLVMDQISKTNFSIPWEIYNFKFIPDAKWNSPLSMGVFDNAYKTKQLIIPLPGKVNTITKEMKEFVGNAKDAWWFIEQKINFIYDSLPEEWRSYIFVDHNTSKYWDYYTNKIDGTKDIVLVKSKMNLINMSVEDWALKLWSYNENAFQSLKDTLEWIIPVKREWYIDDTTKEISNEISMANKISEYFNDLELKEMPGAAFQYMSEDVPYFVKLVNSRKAIINNYSNYQFIDMNIVAADLKFRWIITSANPTTLDWVYDDLFIKSSNDPGWVVNVNTLKISDWFLETINSSNNYWLELMDDLTFSVEKFELINRLMVRSYVSANHADLMFAQLELLSKFMVQTPENIERYRELITPLQIRNTGNGVDLNNIALRWTVKNLVYNDLMKSWLPDAISSYVMRADEVMDFLIDNQDVTKKLINDLLVYKRSKWDVSPLHDVTVPTQLSIYLKNFYERNSKELSEWFRAKTWREYNVWELYERPVTIDKDKEIVKWSTLKSEEDELKYSDDGYSIIGDDVIENSNTAQQGLVLMFLNDHILNVIEDSARIQKATSFHIYDKMTRGYYLKDNNIDRYINWMNVVDLDWLIKKNSFDKVLKFYSKNKETFLKTTESMMDDTLVELSSFYDTTIDAWKRVAWKEYAPYFFKKEQIDNLFWEVYVQTRRYMNFLENNFWWTTALNKILSEVKASTYSLDRFSKVTTETLELYTDTIDRIKAAIVKWHKDILAELENMNWSFDMTRLIKTWETWKLTTADYNWKKILASEWYDLNDFILQEAKKLWYKITDKFMANSSTSVKQIKLVWMYAEQMQNLIDIQSMWHLDKATLRSFFFKDSSIRNPMRWKWHLFVWEDERIKEVARTFWNKDQVLAFNIYSSFNLDEKMGSHLFNFFQDLWIDFWKNADDIINAIDLTIKANTTLVNEWYLRTIYDGRDFLTKWYVKVPEVGYYKDWKNKEWMEWISEWESLKRKRADLFLEGVRKNINEFSYYKNFEPVGETWKWKVPNNGSVILEWHDLGTISFEELSKLEKKYKKRQLEIKEKNEAMAQKALSAMKDNNKSYIPSSLEYKNKFDIKKVDSIEPTVMRDYKKDFAFIVYESIFKSMYDFFEQDFIKSFSKKINKDDKWIRNYVEAAVEKLEKIKLSRIDLKELKSKEILWHLQTKSKEFKYLEKRFLDMTEALRWYVGNPAYQIMDNKNFWLNIWPYNLSIYEIIENKENWKAISSEFNSISEKLDQEYYSAMEEMNNDTFWIPKEIRDEALQDMLVPGEDDIRINKWKGNLQFATDAQEKLLNKVDLEKKLRYKTPDEYLKNLFGNDRWVSRYVNYDWSIGGTSDLKSIYYDQKDITQKERNNKIAEYEENEMFRSMAQPDYSSINKKLMKDSVKMFDDMMKENKDLFTDCIII